MTKNEKIFLGLVILALGLAYVKTRAAGSVIMQDGYTPYSSNVPHYLSYNSSPRYNNGIELRLPDRAIQSEGGATCDICSLWPSTPSNQQVQL